MKSKIISEEELEYISMIYNRPELQHLLRAIMKRPEDKQEDAINFAINTFILLGGSRQ